MDHVAGHETLFFSSSFDDFAFGLCGLEYIVLWLLAKNGPPLWGLKWWYGYKTSQTRWNFRNSHIHPDTPTTFTTVARRNVQKQYNVTMMATTRQPASKQSERKNTNMKFMELAESFSPGGFYFAFSLGQMMKNSILIQLKYFIFRGHSPTRQKWNKVECETFSLSCKWKFSRQQRRRRRPRLII